MGMTVECKKTGRSLDMGAGGFLRWRLKIAELYNQKWYEHYRTLMEPPLCHSDEWYAEFDKETERLLNEEHLDIKILDFCLQSDVDGHINYGACKNILKAIGDYTNNVAYTYVAFADHDWDRLKAILQDCVDTKSRLIWY